MSKRAPMHFFICVILVGANFYFHDLNWYWGLVPLFSVLVLGVLPLLLSQPLFKFKWSDLGIRRVENAKGITALFAGAMILSALVVFSGMRLTDAGTYYRELLGDKSAVSGGIELGFFFLLSVIVMEFFFRGFFLMGSRSLRFWGPRTAIIVVMFAEILVHTYKPLPEVFGIAILSPVLSWMSLKSRSLWPALFLHLWVEASVLGALMFAAG